MIIHQHRTDDVQSLGFYIFLSRVFWKKTSKFSYLQYLSTY